MIKHHNILAYANFVKTQYFSQNCSLRSKILATNVHDLVEANFPPSHSSSTDVSSTRSEWQDNSPMKMAGSKILTRRQLEKMTNDQLIEFAMKL